LVPISAHTERKKKEPQVNDPYAPPAAALNSLTPSPYLAVSQRKLAVMTIGTCGMYAVYWCYRQWAAHKLANRGNQWPWARGWFWGLFVYNLFGKLDAELHKRGHSVNWSPKFRGLVITPTYVLAILLAPSLHPLHGGVLAIVSLAVNTYMLVGTLPAVNLLANDPRGASNAHLTWANAIWLFIGLLVWASMVLSIIVAFTYPELYA
jgi:hypothetical protein